jgi:hypothetical protein
VYVLEKREDALEGDMVMMMVVVWCWLWKILDAFCFSWRGMGEKILGLGD